MAKPETRKFYVLGGRGEDQQVYIKAIPQGGFIVIGQIVANVEQAPIMCFGDNAARKIVAPESVDGVTFARVMEKAIAHTKKVG